MRWFVVNFFVAVFGGCVGSFLNVLIYRLPEGLSILWPPSRCPQCATPLKWYDNIPVLGWLLLRGRCRYCEKAISVQYPLIEAVTAILFVAMLNLYYQTTLVQPFGNFGLELTWPVFALHLVLVAVLLGATVIDARYFIIPLSLPWFATVAAVVVLPLYAHFAGIVTQGLLPHVTRLGIHMALGGLAGLALSLLLLVMHILPRSFDDEEAQALDTLSSLTSSGADAAVAQAEGQPVSPDTAVEAPTLPGADPAASEAAMGGGACPPPVAVDPQVDPQLDAARRAEMFLSYSHPRREVLKEALFLGLPVLGAILSALYLPDLIQGGYPNWATALGGVACGYLVGGGLVWFTRVLGTLAFGREAMGLGDVHLLAAIGAVLGPKAAVMVFFIAPFLGLAYVAIAVGVSKAVKGQVRIIPYGPYLALAALLLMMMPEPFKRIFQIL